MQSFEDKKMKSKPLLALALMLAAPFCTAIAHEFPAGPITIDDPRARASIGADVAERVSLHESREEGGVMKMGPVEGGIEVPAHGTAELKPLGLHVMLMKLNRPLKDGDTFPMTLVFEKQGKVPVEVKVQQAPRPWHPDQSPPVMSLRQSPSQGPGTASPRAGDGRSLAEPQRQRAAEAREQRLCSPLNKATGTGRSPCPEGVCATAGQQQQHEEAAHPHDRADARTRRHEWVVRVHHR
jgi:copper(I)-binding protein